MVVLGQWKIWNPGEARFHNKLSRMKRVHSPKSYTQWSRITLDTWTRYLSLSSYTSFLPIYDLWQMLDWAEFALFPSVSPSVCQLQTTYFYFERFQISDNYSNYSLLACVFMSVGKAMFRLIPLSIHWDMATCRLIMCLQSECHLIVS